MTASALRALHHDRTRNDPLVLAGPWDVSTAQVFESAGFPALATAGAAISAAFGYQDNAMPQDEMFAAVARIARAVQVPVSADVEDGYGLEPRDLVARILGAGAVGCNLEDSVHRELKDPERHAEWLAEVRSAAGDALFINARIDTFILGASDPEPAIDRARLYVAAGVDCIYPIAAPTQALAAIRAEIPGPINAIATPERTALKELGELGITRITFGPYLQHAAMAAVKSTAEQLIDWARKAEIAEERADT
jgi:2-methylisocitrate lyase-like PEP mutase family enzyme